MDTFFISCLGWFFYFKKDQIDTAFEFNKILIYLFAFPLICIADLMY